MRLHTALCSALLLAMTAAPAHAEQIGAVDTVFKLIGPEIGRAHV